MAGFRSLWRSPISGTAPPSTAPPPAFLRQRSSTVFIVATICVAIFTDIFLYGLVVPVMPFALTARLGIAANRVQRWNAILFACYGIALFVGSPIVGMYADHTSSRRLPLLMGLVALAGATVMLCVGRSIGLFVAGRLMQGASAAVVWSVGLALLADTMGSRMGLAMGSISIAMSAGLLLAPLIGGYVYAGAGYYAVYYVAFGLIALDIVLRLLLIEKKVARQWVEQDVEDRLADQQADQQAGQLTGGPASRDEESQLAEQAAVSLPPVSTPSVFLRMWMLLCVRRMASALFGGMVMASILTAFDTILPLFVKSEFGWGSTASGLLFFAPYLPPALVSPLAGVVADRWGAKGPALAGFAATLPLLVCLRFVDGDTMGNKVLLAVLLAVLGVTMTLANVPMMAEISFAIEAEEAARPGVWGPSGVYGIGYGLFTTSFALGSAIGSLLAGYLQADFGWATTTWCLAVWCAVGGLVVALWVGEFRLGRPAEGQRPQGRDEEAEERQKGGGGEDGKRRGKAETTAAGDETGKSRDMSDGKAEPQGLQKEGCVTKSGAVDF
ncbi:major facilitator superfamily transporter amine [Grosmannia clavigera kw1407]|uniref:Major facilitator superfamily transporter amine n=1 Tax=Grosmannia clavigera (strain kw1407 / UAMH 11150) TaxID=655863 RepID=F0XSS1_GROCL|nr:major facilitator superfamily transporter amine [Grosmannia clavigera kw1407]EFW99181.1 major facilitator superfamily transporter amine [Grosmannia clavigera kw1407]